MIYPKRYSKDLTRLTTFRLSERLRDDAEKCAELMGISFSDFLRQSLTRNVHVAIKIEEEVNRQNSARAMGKSQ